MTKWLSGEDLGVLAPAPIALSLSVRLDAPIGTATLLGARMLSLLRLVSHD